jgi:lipopolysaccharide transport system permease protein
MTIIRASQGWVRLGLGELWRHRELLYFLTWRDVAARYRQTLVGTTWAILQPLLAAVVFTVFFGNLAKVATGGVPYAVFTYSGLLP